MITNFENETEELSEKELALVPIMVDGFKKITKEKPWKSDDIIKRVNAKDYGCQLTQPRLRKICNYIRVNGMIPLIATSSGYYVSYEKDEIMKQIISLEQRARSIQNCADGLRGLLIELDLK